MGVTIQQGTSEIPEVADGLALSRFDGMAIEKHPDWATESDKFGKPDSGDRIRFEWTLLDEETGAVLYGEDGDPVVVNQLTRVFFGAQSRTYALLKGILTKAELALVDAKEPIDSDALIGRINNLNISHNEKGWPQIDAVIPATPKQIKLVAAAE